jgi:DNA-directed RNA polymerase specialized sigma24 family protein
MQPLLERGVEDPLDSARMLDTIKSRIEKMAAYFGRQCGVDADDLRQEAWVAVLETLPNLDPTVGSPEQHLLKRARWRILDSMAAPSAAPGPHRSGVEFGLLFGST